MTRPFSAPMSRCIARHSRSIRAVWLVHGSTEPDRVDLDDPRWRQVLSVRPGVVSYAILRLASTYNHSPPEQRLRLEGFYVDRASLGFDLRLLASAASARCGIWRLNIAAAWQGKGYGRFAGHSVLDEARRRGQTRATVLWV